MNPSNNGIGVMHCDHSWNYQRASFEAHREPPAPARPARVEPVDAAERIFQALHSIGKSSGPQRTTMRDSDRRPFFDGEGQLLTLSDADSKLVWIQLAKSGTFAGHSAGPFELNDRVFREIVANFKADRMPIPIDFEHASEQPATEGSIPTSGAPATGWIRDLRIEGSDLFALVEWLSPGREQIRAGAYKYISPAVRFNSVDRVTGKPIGARLTSAGLTNTPFLRSMQVLAARDQSPSALAARLMSDRGLSFTDAYAQASQMIRGGR